MLPEIKLDTNGFEDIMRKARSQIGGICPEWTDYNYHDPGITFLELFAFLTEAQQFYLDQVGEDTERKFLRLAGITLKERAPAVTAAEVRLHEPVSLPAGSRFSIGQVTFETVVPEHLPGLIVSSVIIREKGQEPYILDRTLLSMEGQMRIYPFGRRTSVGNECLFCLSKPLKPGRSYHLSLYFSDHYGVKRSPWQPGERFTPLSEIQVSFYGNGGYRKIPFEDETHGFIESGRIRFIPDWDMEQTQENGRQGYFLKITLTVDSFDVVPVITAADFNHINLVQKETKAAFLPVSEAEGFGGTDKVLDYYRRGKDGYYIESGEEEGEVAAVYETGFYQNRILAQATGFPNQSYFLGVQGVLAASLTILTASIEKDGWFRMWKQVDDFDSSGPEDCHYMVDEKTGTIRFGDGVQGRMPETQIRLAGCAVSMDEQGNITSGKPFFCQSLPDRALAVNFRNASGGTGPETPEQGFVRAAALFKESERLVTAKDYEKAVKRTPGLRIEECKVLDQEDVFDTAPENQVGIVVRPYAEQGYAALSPVYRRNIMDYLDKKRLLGTSVRLYTPEYIETEIYAEVSGWPQYAGVKEAVEQTIRQFFQQIRGFGRPVNHGHLLGAVDGMEEVRQVYMLSINARGNHISRNKNGDVLIPPMGVLVLKRVECVTINR